MDEILAIEAWGVTQENYQIFNPIAEGQRASIQNKNEIALALGAATILALRGGEENREAARNELAIATGLIAAIASTHLGAIESIALRDGLHAVTELIECGESVTMKRALGRSLCTCSYLLPPTYLYAHNADCPYLQLMLKYREEVREHEQEDTES